MRMRWTVTLLTLVCSTPIVLGACENILASATLKGKKFFSSKTGEYIPIKGINYYPRPNAGELTISNSIDFFTVPYRHIWERDIENFIKLNVNAIRLYAVDPGQNHDAFMCALKSAGIYVIVGLAASCDGCAIGKEQAPDCYSPDLKTRGQFIIHEFSRYDNVLAFSAGNEANHFAPPDHPEVNAPCQKQFVRDMRAYIQRCPSMRQIPVGVETADANRDLNALYYNCRSDPKDELENAEFYGINVYLHCDGSAGTIDKLYGYQELQADFKGYGMNIPVMLTEFGCLNPSFPTIDGFEAQRDFLQVEAIFSSSYAEEFAGGFVFEYSTELVLAESTSPYPFIQYGAGNFGVGYFEPETCDDIATNCTYFPFPQFETLANAYGAVDSSFATDLASYTPDQTSFPDCPSEFPPLSSFVWPSSFLEDSSCPDPLIVYCPNIPVECTTTPASITPAPSSVESTDSPTTSPSTKVPKPSPTEKPEQATAPVPITNSTRKPSTQPPSATSSPGSSTKPSTSGPSTQPPSATSSTGVPTKPLPTGPSTRQPVLQPLSSLFPTSSGRIPAPFSFWCMIVLSVTCAYQIVYSLQ